MTEPRIAWVDHAEHSSAVVDDLLQLTVTKCAGRDAWLWYVETRDVHTLARIADYDADYDADDGDACPSLAAAKAAAVVAARAVLRSTLATLGDSLVAPVAVGGDRLETTLNEHVRTCCVLIGEEQCRANPDNAVIAALCNSVRLARELEQMATRKG